jgi:hypothetical protein
MEAIQILRLRTLQSGGDITSSRNLGQCLPRAGLTPRFEPNLWVHRPRDPCVPGRVGWDVADPQQFRLEKYLLTVSALDRHARSFQKTFEGSRPIRSKSRYQGSILR